MQPVETVIDFSTWGGTIPSIAGLYKLEHLTRETYDGEPLMGHNHYVIADEYQAHALVRIPNNLSIFADTELDLVRDFAVDTWGSDTIYRWDEYFSEWRVV